MMILRKPGRFFYSILVSISKRLKLREIYLVIRFKFLSFLKRLNIRTALAAAGIIGPLMLFAGDLTAATHTPGYYLVRDSISSLALTQIGWLQTIGFLALGLLVEIFTAGLLFNVKRSRWFHIGILCLMMFGFGMLCIGAFHTDIPGTVVKTINGTIHGIATAISFSLFPVAAWLLAYNYKKDHDWRHMFRYSQVTCILSIILAITLQFFKDGVNYFGIIERVLVANMILWVEVSAINLLRLSLRHHPQLDNEPEIG
jgi:hypothetical protein